MKNLLFISSFILLCALANASKPLVSSFVTHLTTSLSFLSQEDIDDEFDVNKQLLPDSFRSTKFLRLNLDSYLTTMTVTMFC